MMVGTPPLRVHVRFFASLKELTGLSAFDLDLAPGSTVHDLWEACVSRWPTLASRRATTVVSVNLEFSRTDVVLNNGDEVALLPPVSGGSNQ